MEAWGVYGGGLWISLDKLWISQWWWSSAKRWIYGVSLWLGSARVWLEGEEGLCGSIQSNLSSVHPEGRRKGLPMHDIVKDSQSPASNPTNLSTKCQQWNRPVTANSWQWAAMLCLQQSHPTSCKLNATTQTLATPGSSTNPDPHCLYWSVHVKLVNWISQNKLMLFPNNSHRHWASLNPSHGSVAKQMKSAREGRFGCEDTTGVASALPGAALSSWWGLQ